MLVSKDMLFWRNFRTATSVPKTTPGASTSPSSNFSTCRRRYAKSPTFPSSSRKQTTTVLLHTSREQITSPLSGSCRNRTPTTTTRRASRSATSSSPRKSARRRRGRRSTAAPSATIISTVCITLDFIYCREGRFSDVHKPGENLKPWFSSSNAGIRKLRIALH